jgi:hypothetical protein
MSKNKVDFGLTKVHYSPYTVTDSAITLLVKKISVYFLVIVTFVMLVSCDKSKAQIIIPNQYAGQKLNIGIIGEAPKVLVQQVKFVEINFSDLGNDGFDAKYDGIFITKDNLSEASQNKYKSIYKNSKIPFFFIENKKSNVPFTEENLSYEEVPDLEEQGYISGFMYKDNKLNSWGFELNYNEIDNKANIEEFYYKIFDIISKNKTENANY